MKRIIPILLAAVAFISSCNEFIDKSADKKLIEQNDSLKIVIEKRDSSINEMLECIRIVEEGFADINKAQGRIDIAGNNEQSRENRLKEDIEYITLQLNKNKEYIERLRAILAENSSATKELKATIERLETALEQKNIEIADLYEKLRNKELHISRLDTIIDNLTRHNTAQEIALMENEKAMNSVWYVIGSKKELKKEKILSSGEVMLNSSANKGYFTKADKTNLNEIKTYSRKAKILSTHPEDSYRLEKDANKNIILRILNSDSFWSITRYLVIQTR